MSNDATSTSTTTSTSTSTILTISCDTCVMRTSAHCADCLVTVMSDEGGCDRGIGSRGDDAVVLDLAELRAVRLLADAGLVPTLRHREAI